MNFFSKLFKKKFSKQSNLLNEDKNAFVAESDEDKRKAINYSTIKLSIHLTPDDYFTPEIAGYLECYDSSGNLITKKDFANYGSDYSRLRLKRESFYFVCKYNVDKSLESLVDGAMGFLLYKIAERYGQSLVCLSEILTEVPDQLNDFIIASYGSLLNAINAYYINDDYYDYEKYDDPYEVEKDFVFLELI